MTLLSSWETCHAKTQLPHHLPIAEHEGDIVQAIVDHPVVIIAGETGSGKTTQVPKLCIKAGLGKKGKILMTQPRRLAAMRTAMRIAEEMELELGEEIGYRIRFHHRSSPKTLLDVVTDGIPLSGNLKNDPFAHCEVVIVDEVHERSINIDLILGLLKRTRERRPNLKIILMSATLDLERLSEFFPESKTLTVSGRTHPVELEYVETDKEASLPEKVCSQVSQLLRREVKGNVLCFLPTERDIRESEQKLSAQLPERFECLPLYSRLSQKDQDRVFKTHQNQQKVILATNIAETSLTLPDIKTVIDSGYVRLLRYHPGRGIPLLEVENISKASANQRSGRAGRTAPGHCVRLYTEEDFDLMEEHTVPEIKRQDLAQVILKLIALGLEQPEQFPFVEKPLSKAFSKGIDQLEFLQAIQKSDQGWSITPLGRGMVKLPLTPRLAHLMIHAKRDKLTAAMAVISANLSIQDPRITPADQQEAARTSHQRWKTPQSDFLGMLKLFETYHREKRKRSQNQLKKWCRESFLEWRRMREWDQLSHELCDLMKGKWNIDFENINEIRFHQLILGSHLDCLLERDQKSKRGQYHSFGRREIITHPSSSLSHHMQDWAVCSGFLSTSQLFALNLCRVEPKWILQLAKDMIHTQRGDPYFDEKSQKVVSEEKHFFKNHIIFINKYKDHFPYDVDTSTEVFIRQGFLEGKCQHKDLEIFNHLVKTLEFYDAAERKRDHYAHSERLVEAWKEKWDEPCSRLSDFKKLNPALRQLELQDILENKELMTCIEDFPLSCTLGEKEYPIHYTYHPGKELDGASLQIDQQGLIHIDQMELEQLVPRYLQERLHQAYQSLPNAIRKEFDEAAFKEDLHKHWQSFPDYSLTELFKIWLEQLTQHQKAIERALREFETRQEPHQTPKLCLLNQKGKKQEVITNITTYLGKSESSLIKKLAQRNKNKCEVRFKHLEEDDIPTRCDKILNELKTWPDSGKILAKTQHKEIKAWPALIYKNDQWKIIAHQNQQRAQHLTLTHLGLCLGVFSPVELNLDAEELDRLKDLRQGMQQSLNEIQEVSRLSLWIKVRPQDLENYQSLTQRIQQLEKKKWPKLARRWLKWMVTCTQLFQASLSLDAKTPKEAELRDKITKLTQAGAPKAKELLTYDLSKLEEETQELFMLMRWQQTKGIDFEQASLNWRKLKLGFEQLERHRLCDTTQPWKEEYLNIPYDALSPSDLDVPLQTLNQKTRELEAFEQELEQAQKTIQQIQAELQLPKNEIFIKEIGKEVESLAQIKPHNQNSAYSENIKNLKEKWGKLKERKVDLLEKQTPVTADRLKQALQISWKTKHPR